MFRVINFNVCFQTGFEGKSSLRYCDLLLLHFREWEQNMRSVFFLYFPFLSTTKLINLSLLNIQMFVSTVFALKVFSISKVHYKTNKDKKYRLH
jgi:hypothetical protein